jgi:hypothetical protein
MCLSEIYVFKKQFISAVDSALSSSDFTLVVFEEGDTYILTCDFTLRIKTYLTIFKESGG